MNYENKIEKPLGVNSFGKNIYYNSNSKVKVGYQVQFLHLLFVGHSHKYSYFEVIFIFYHSNQ